jgi:hypothetical protein
VVLAQEIENLFGFGGLGEGGVTTQIAEHDDDVTTMAFKDFFVALGDDQFGGFKLVPSAIVGDTLMLRASALRVWKCPVRPKDATMRPRRATAGLVFVPLGTQAPPTGPPNSPGPT